MNDRILPQLALAAAVAGLMSIAGTSPSQAGSVQVGVLNCTVSGGTGFIIGSTKNLICTFKHAGGRRETYSGTIRKFGIDIGSTDRSYISWAVFAPSKKVRSGALSGGYGGVSAEATVGAGIGANALIGGFDKSFTLQPLSLQAQSGLNIAAGIASLDLRAR